MDEETGREKRRGPDFWCKMIRWMEIQAWILAGAILCLLGLAKPRSVTLYDRFYGSPATAAPAETAWNFYALRWALVLMVVLLGTCGYGLFVNAHRHARKEDRYSVSLMLLGALSAVGIMLLFVLRIQ
ncbi:hypothetical protein EDC14_1006122 [Hydrogenispora ethanolica]|jgi:cation transport ATPase|uniref:Uncharacterized protein n=1 Tax=Hydrogenispora ethanolica TaxID=1082276 RepID=A0A4R1S267_HYDET|nr:hypothetical protein [Hydrogenispora ethanolica]TCL72412.1 hypothetical protein EDC14_1006122 [Hydrogenispora ethanolica]